MADNEKLSALRQGALLKRRDEMPESVIDVLPTEVDTYTSLRSYWDILSKRRWEVLTCVLATITLVTIYSFKMKPIYRATSRLEIEAETPLVQSIKDLYGNMPTDEAFLQTQVKVLESDSLAWQTIEQLKLAQNPAFHSSSGASIEPAPDSPVMRVELTNQFKRALEVTLVRSTHVVEVSFESTDPDLSATVANSLVHNYIEYNFQKKYDATRQAGEWMGQQLDELKAKVEKSQEQLVSYERANAIVNVNDKQTVSEQKLSDLTKELTIAQGERAQKESLYEMIKSSPDQVALLTQNELLQKLEEKYADLKGQYVDALAQYGPKFPKVLRLEDQVNEIQSLIDRERKRSVARIENDYHAAVVRERLIGDEVERQKLEVGRLNQLLIGHNILQREFESNQQLYESLLQRLKDATVSEGLRATNIHTVDTALAPAFPVRPKKLLNIAIGAMVGLMLGMSLAFVLEGLEHSTVKTAEDVEGLVPATCLALIPLAGSGASRYGMLKRGEPHAPQDGKVALTVLNDPTSPVAESYRALRSAILFSSTPQPPQVLVVTSAQPNEGKTSTSLNLAAVLAQNRARVLIVEGDMRNPGIAQALGLAEKRGLTGVLTGAHSLDEALHRVESASDLWLLPAGPHPPNPAELLSSSTMETVMGELRRRFEFIVLDSPPLLLVTDATILSTLADGVILVAESGVTAPAALVRAHRTLVLSGSKILGIVVNKIDSRQNGYYYGSYHKYYGSYYGRSEKEVSAKS